MRITNKIMQNNSLYNINNNKILEDKLNSMMSTQKKITRPSDDPVIAIRALRLRTSVSELTQYYDKNAPDAESWLDVTGKALSTVTDVLTDMIKQVNKGSNKDYGPEDLQVILEQMKSLKNEVYSTGNVDYAGRYVFTGFRTDTTLSFTEEVEEQPEGYPSYKITEQRIIGDFDSINYTDIGRLEGLNKNNYTDGKYGGITEQSDVRNGDIHRLRLAYDDLKAEDITITIPDPTDPDNPLATISPTTASVADDPDPYQQMLDANEAGNELVLFIPETGEVLFSNASYAALEGTINNPKTEIQVSYTKNQWRDGDLRPEHYFACEGTTLDKDGNEKVVNYNPEYLTGEGKKQVIEYDVGYNQKIQVNTTADEVFGHNLDRDIDDFELAISQLAEMSATMEDMRAVFKEMDESTPGYNDVKLKYEASEKAYSYMREKVHNMFENMTTKLQGYLDDTNKAITDNGTRSQRLDLISDRLMDQKTNFKTLQSENEDIDIAEVVIQLTSAQLTYNSALMATGKIMQSTLMNYI